MSLQAIMNQIGGVETGQMTFIGTPRLSSSQRNSHNLTLVLTSSTLRYIFRTCFSKLKKGKRPGKQRQQGKTEKVHSLNCLEVYHCPSIHCTTSKFSQCHQLTIVPRKYKQNLIHIYS